MIIMRQIILIILYLCQFTSTSGSQKGVTILSEKIWTTGNIKAYIVHKKDNKPSALQIGVRSFLENMTVSNGLQTKIWSGHKYFILNTDHVTVDGLFKAKFCYHGNNCAYVERRLRVISGYQAVDVVYLNLIVENLPVGAYPMFSETTFTDIKTYYHKAKKILLVKPFPYDD